MFLRGTVKSLTDINRAVAISSAIGQPVNLRYVDVSAPRPQGTAESKVCESLEVAPEVSALDFTDGVTISGFTVPGLSVRNVNTEVEFAEAQSFAIGGLLDNRETETFNKIPFIGDIPVLGKFFQSKSTTKQNTELMVIITPEIVRPIPAGQPLPSLNYPAPFLPANTSKNVLSTGQQTATLANAAPGQRSVPVEALVESMKPERPLIVTSSSAARRVVCRGTGGDSAQVGGLTFEADLAPAITCRRQFAFCRQLRDLGNAAT